MLFAIKLHPFQRPIIPFCSWKVHSCVLFKDCIRNKIGTNCHEYRPIPSKYTVFQLFNNVSLIFIGMSGEILETLKFCYFPATNSAKMTTGSFVFDSDSAAHRRFMLRFSFNVVLSKQIVPRLDLYHQKEQIFHFSLMHFIFPLECRAKCYKRSNFIISSDQ